MSIILPGVPITMCGYFSRDSICWEMDAPPISNASLKFIPWPNMDIWSVIWSASSRLGAIISAHMLNGYFESFCIKGRPNTAVLPVPVSEFMIALSPLRIGGIASFWIGV
jgi:hypothetical protein